MTGRSRCNRAVDGSKVLGYRGTHELGVIVSNDLGGGPADVFDKVLDGRKDIMFQGLETIDVFISGGSIDCKESIFDTIYARRTAIANIQVNGVAEIGWKGDRLCGDPAFVNGGNLTKVKNGFTFNG